LSKYFKSAKDAGTSDKEWGGVTLFGNVQPCTLAGVYQSAKWLPVTGYPTQPDIYKRIHEEVIVWLPTLIRFRSVIREIRLIGF
jgi:hypothetical protein